MSDKNTLPALLIEKISQASEWFVTHETPSRIARSTFIEEIKKSDLPPLEKSVLIQNCKKIIKEYNNQIDVVNYAIQHLSETATPSKMDDDWIAAFMDCVRLINSDELKQLWGYLLAQECNNPGNIPRYLIRILESLDPYLAKAFSLVKVHSIYIIDNKPRYTPVIFYEKHQNYFDKLGLNVDIFTDLEAIGLISFNSFPGYGMASDQEHVKFCYGTKLFSVTESGTPNFNTGNVMLTHFGEKLCQLIDVNESPDFIEVCLPDIDIQYQSI